MTGIKIVDQAKLFVIDFFENHEDQKFVFHTLGHTMYVVKHAALLGKEEGLEETEMEAVLVAAWFHDTGYMIDMDGHEASSIQLAESFFKKHPVSDEFADLVVRCINSTCRKNPPELSVEKVIMDADVAHVAEDNFISISKKLRKERSLCQKTEIPAKDYWEETLAFLQNLSFYTSYGQSVFEPAKDLNVLKVQEIIDDFVVKESKVKDSVKDRSTAKGIESMFRLTASNQMRLTSVADKKANILISINSILLSVSAAVASSEPVFTGDLTPSVTVLFVSSLASLIFAILSCRPQVNNRKYSEDDLKARNVNLIFFGDFHQVPLPQYDAAMKEMMHDYDYPYSNLIKDQYYLGQSLYRKFKLLRIAYNIFMVGFVLAAFVFAFGFLIKA